MMRLDEFLARCLAARKMGLIKDPHGIRIPEELWRQAMPDAEFLVGALMAFDLMQTVAHAFTNQRRRTANERKAEEILGLLRSIDARFRGLEERLKLKAVKAPKEVRWIYLDPKPVRASMAEKDWNQSDLARQLRVGKDRSFSLALQASNAFHGQAFGFGLQQFVDNRMKLRIQIQSGARRRLQGSQRLRSPA